MISGPDIKKERMILDTAIVSVAFILAYLTGYFQSMNLGAATAAILLPNILLLGLIYVHLVLRKGRRYDESEHRKSYEFFKTGVFLALLISSYTAGLSTDGSFLPQNSVSATASLISAALNLYILAYRPNK